MADLVEQLADLQGHHIEGYARAAIEQGLDGHFSCPLVSEVLPGLWQGGCRDGARLPDDFDLVIALFQGERYVLGPSTHRFDITAYDSAEVPDLAVAAKEAHTAWKAGNKVLIHCQAGLNRSGLVAAQVLMLDGYTAQDAIDLLRESRSPMVLCNKAFEDHLLGIVA